MRSFLPLWVLVGATLPACGNSHKTETGAAAAAVSCTPAAPTVSPGKLISPTRQLRRITLTLLGRPPKPEELAAMEAATTPDAQRALLAQTIDAALASPEFYRQMVNYGHELLPIPSYNVAYEGSYWTGSMAFDLVLCPPESAHPGAYSMSADECKDAAATTVVSPAWFSPGKPVTFVGQAGSTTTVSESGKDCGSTYIGGLYNVQPDKGCGCGPGAQWCILSANLSYGTSYDQANFSLEHEISQRRQIWDEPARLLAHVIFQDRPFTDLVLGNYTVAPVTLKNLYARWGRMNPDNKALDQSSWWKPETWSKLADPENTPGSVTAWHEVIQQDLHPNLLSLMPAGTLGADPGRTYTFDPRKDPGKPQGIGSAGLLTTIGALGALPRERVRAARWLEVLSCQLFVPPPPEIHFAPYKRDPATEGTCQNCHVAIDPAAIHFKRPGINGNYMVIGGLGAYGFEGKESYAAPWNRWNQAFLPNTRLTPISEEDAKAHPDWRLLDFLPPDQKLFDQVSDGTTGPLGFAKLLVQSGRFDQCAAQRIFERFVGRHLDAATDKARLDAITQQFLKGGRKVKPFVRDLLLEADELKRGL